MAKQSLLLVDGDARSLRVLEVSLKKAGFNVTTAIHGKDALDKVQTAPPDLIISDTDMPEMDGFAFCEELKTNSQWADIPFIFLTEETSIENKIRGLELGVEDYLTKPIYIKEILTRIRILLQKHQRARLESNRGNRTRFAGRISDIGVVDLIQTIEVSRKSGLIQFRATDERRAVLYFRGGKVVDAEAGPLSGQDAVYRLLTWSDGDFEVVFRNVRRKDVIQMSSQGLLMEGMRRLDEWGRLLEQLPPLDTCFEVDTEELSERLADFPDEFNSILKLFDGRRNLMEIIDASDQGDLECLEVIAKLYFEGLIIEVEQKAQASAARAPEQQSARGSYETVPGSAASPDDDVLLGTDADMDMGSAGDPELTISQEELDMAEVDVAPKAQTSLVEAAIGAAAPVVPPLDERGEVFPAPPEHGAGGEGSDPDDDEFPAVGVVSSEGAEVAVASGEFDVPRWLMESTDPAREIVTIVPNRGDGDRELPEQDLAGAEPRASDELSSELAAQSPEEDEAEDTPGQPAEPVEARSEWVAQHDEGDGRDGAEALAHGDAEHGPGREYDGGVAAEDADHGTGSGDARDGAEHGDAEYEVERDDREDGGEPDGAAGLESDQSEPEEDDPEEDDSELGPEDEPRVPAVGPIDDALEPARGGRGWLAAGVLGVALIVLAVVALRGGGPAEESSPAGPSHTQVANTAAVVLPADASQAPVDAGRPARPPASDASQPADAQPADARRPVQPGPEREPETEPEPETEREPEPEAEPEKGYKEFFAGARRAYRRKQHEQALELIEQALAERTTVRALTLKADILLDKGEAGRAAEVIDQAVAKGARYAQAWLIKGQVHLAEKQDARARAAFEKYLQLEPEGEDADVVRMLLDTMH